MSSTYRNGGEWQAAEEARFWSCCLALQECIHSLTLPRPISSDWVAKTTEIFFFPEFRHQNVIMAVCPPNALGRSSSLLLLACGYQMSLVPCLSLHKAIFPLFVTISRVASTYQNTSHWITAPPNPIRPLINNPITSAKTQFPN